MKKIFTLLATFIICLVLSSCVTTAQTKDDLSYDGDIDVNIIVTNRIPYYRYYYPFYYNNRYYRYRHYRPLPPFRTNRYRVIPKHRPNIGDYRNSNRNVRR